MMHGGSVTKNSRLSEERKAPSFRLENSSGKRIFVTGNRKLLSFTRGLTFKTLIPLIIAILIIVSVFGLYLSTMTKNKSKEFLIENTLMPEFGLLAKEKDTDFEDIKKLTEFTAQSIEDKIQDSKGRMSEEIDKMFSLYMSKKPDGSYRSSLDESKGRYQMAAFINNINNKSEPDILHKGIFVDAFSFFEPFSESLLPFVFTTYFASANSIWQYGFPDWALTSPPNESFDVYNWFYEADPVHNPDKGHTWTDMYYDALQNQWMISSLMPIYDGEEFLGIVGQDLILQKITEITNRSNVGETGILFFIDNLDNIVAHPDTEYLIGKKVKNDEILNLKTIPDKALTKALQKLPNETHYIFTEENNRRLVMSFPLKSIPWKMVYVIDENEFLKIVDQTNQQYLLYFLFFALVIIIIVGSIIKIRVTGPMKKFIEVTNKISKGQLNEQINIQSKDEIGELASSFNQMTQDLKKSKGQIEGHSKDLEKQVSQRTTELNKKVKELTDTKTAILNMLDDVNVSKDDLEKSHKDLLKLNKNMKKANVELKKSEEYKNQFISITAHELKTPLASIHGFAGLLQNKKILSNPKQRNYYLDIIQEDSERLKKLIDDILDLSRLDIGTMKFMFEEMSLSDLFRNLVKEMYVLATKNGLVLNAKIASNVPEKIVADKSRLTQVLVNLVSNAIKYTPKKGGKIKVYAVKKRNMILFSVEDTGIGIPKPAYHKLFQRFYQVDSWLTRKVGGSGLGLSICKGIVEAMGGKIGFKSKVNKGSTFFFTLPVKSIISAASGEALQVLKVKEQDNKEQNNDISDISLSPSKKPEPISGKKDDFRK